MLRVGKWSGLIAFTVIGGVAAARLGRENLWFAPIVLTLTALCLIITTRLVGKTERGKRHRRP